MFSSVNAKAGVKTPYHSSVWEFMITAMSYQSVEPATGKVLNKFKDTTSKHLATSLKAVATCFDTWRFKTFAKRTVIVAKAAANLRARMSSSMLKLA